jgi:hypothetical protein
MKELGSKGKDLPVEPSQQKEWRGHRQDWHPFEDPGVTHVASATDIWVMSLH